MSSCTTQALTSILKECKANKGGIKIVYIAKRDDVASVALNADKTAISTITMQEGGKFHTFEFHKNTGSMTSNLNTSENGNYVTTDLALVFARMDTAKRLSIATLSVDDLAVIAEDANGVRWYLGFDEAVVASAGTGETGTARTDANQYTITLTDESDSYPYEIDATFDISAIVTDES